MTVTNTAGAAGANSGPINFTAAPVVTKNGSNGGTFSLATGAAAGTCAATTVLNPGQSCTVVVQYALGGSTATATWSISVFDTGGATTTQTTPANNNFRAN